jgi:hypothetical protein
MVSSGRLRGFIFIKNRQVVGGHDKWWIDGFGTVTLLPEVDALHGGYDCPNHQIMTQSK